MFLIDDETHCEYQEGKFRTRAEAIAELERRASIPWCERPNRAPCTNWRTCERRYIVIECDDNGDQLSREFVLAISAKGVEWGPTVTLNSSQK
jgi:hypothetical protein